MIHKTNSYKEVRTGTPRLRCYAFPGQRALYLESTKRLRSLKQIKGIVESNSSPSEAALFFVHQKHLPKSLVSQIKATQQEIEQEMQVEIEGFSKFYEVIAFTQTTFLLRKNQSELPASLDSQERATSSRRQTDGFFVTEPTSEIDTTNASSFSTEELESFLGLEFFKYAGKMMVISLDIIKSLEDFKEVANALLESAIEEIFSN